MTSLSDASLPTMNKKLRAARRQYQWTIEQASEKVGVDSRTYRRWEQGYHIPRLSIIRRLCQVFELPAEELGFDI